MNRQMRRTAKSAADTVVWDVADDASIVTHPDLAGLVEDASTVPTGSVPCDPAVIVHPEDSIL